MPPIHTRVIPSPSAGGGGGGGTSDHGSLSGLADDDHPQYLLRTDVVSDVINNIVTDAGAVAVDAGDVVFDPG